MVQKQTLLLEKVAMCSCQGKTSQKHMCLLQKWISWYCNKAKYIRGNLCKFQLESKHKNQFGLQLKSSPN